MIHDLCIFLRLGGLARDELLQPRNVGHELTDRFEVARVRDDRREHLDLFGLIPSRLGPWFVGNDRPHRWILSESALCRHAVLGECISDLRSTTLGRGLSLL